jgi:hypothetical protein
MPQICQVSVPVLLATQKVEIKEDHGLMPVQANSLRDSSRKHPTQKRAGRVAQWWSSTKSMRLGVETPIPLKNISDKST